MAPIILVAIIIAAVVAVCSLIDRSTRKELEGRGPVAIKEGIKSTVPGVEASGSGGSSVKATVGWNRLHDGSVPPRRTLDEMYAAANGMWVCAHCETLNEDTMSHCGACGASR